jgi:hypothetical protein
MNMPICEWFRLINVQDSSVAAQQLSQQKIYRVFQLVQSDKVQEVAKSHMTLISQKRLDRAISLLASVTHLPHLSYLSLVDDTKEATLKSEAIKFQCFPKSHMRHV